MGKTKNIIWFLGALIIIAGIFVSIIFPVKKTPKAALKRFSVREVELGQTNDPIRVLANLTSPNEKHLVSVIIKNGKHQVFMDGKPGALFEGTVALDTQGAINFSPDGEHLAYTIIKNDDKKWFPVIDGIPGPEYDWISKYIVFSPDGHHVAYLGGFMKGKKDLERKEGYFNIQAVSDGKPGPVYESISFNSPKYSPDSKHIVYVAKKDKKSVVVLDGKESGEYDKIGMGIPVFSPDSKHLGFIAQEGRQWTVVIDSKPGTSYEYIPENSLVFSPDSKHYAYAVRRQVLNSEKSSHKSSEAMRVVVDGKVGGEYDAVDAIQFSPDSKHLTYKALQEGYWRIVLDGEDGLEQQGIMEGWPVFSPDSKLLAYWLKTSDTKWTFYLTDVGGDSKDKADGVSLACSCRGITGGQYDGIVEGSLVFSPDSKRVGFVAISGGRKMVVINGKIGEQYDDIGNICFSKDGSQNAYWAIKDKKWRVIVNDSQNGPEWDGIKGGIIFFGDARDPDGIQVAYGVAKGNLRQIVVNGNPIGQSFDKIVTGLVPLTSGEGFEVLIARNKRLYRMYWESGTGSTLKSAVVRQ